MCGDACPGYAGQHDPDWNLPDPAAPARRTSLAGSRYWCLTCANILSSR